MFVEAKEFSQKPLDTIPIGGFSNFLAYDNAEPVNLPVISFGEKDEVLGGKFLPESHHLLKILRIAYLFPPFEPKQPW
jgi:hypothetical protein